MNKKFLTNQPLQFIKKEESTYNNKAYFHFLCNQFDEDGIAHAVKVQVSPEAYNTKLNKGDLFNFVAVITADYLRISVIEIPKQGK